MGVSTCRHHIGGVVGDREALGSAVMHYQRQSCRRLGIQRYKGISRSKRLATHSHKRVEKGGELLLPKSEFDYITVSKGRFKSHYLHIYIRKALKQPGGRVLVFILQGNPFLHVNRLFPRGIALSI